MWGVLLICKAGIEVPNQKNIGIAAAKWLEVFAVELNVLHVFHAIGCHLNLLTHSECSPWQLLMGTVQAGWLPGDS